MGWADWLAHCIGLAWEATTVGEIASDLLPDPFGLPHLTVRFLALASLAAFLALQLVGLRVASASQDLLSLVKAVVFLALVAACFLLPLPAAEAALRLLGPPGGRLITAVALVALLVVAGSFERLLSLGALLYVGLPLTGIAALARLRWRNPEAPRPFRVWAYPLPPLLVAVVSLAFLAGELLTHPWDGLLAGGLVGIGVPILWRASRPAPAPP